MIIKAKLLFPLLFIIALTPSFGQYSVSGLVMDSLDNTRLPMTFVSLINQLDSTKKYTTYSDTLGQFSFSNVPGGKYLLKTYFYGYREKVVPLSVNKSITNLEVSVSPEVQMLSGVTVKGRIPPVEQQGDTTVFNAGSYKTLPGSDTEDLVRKMPGVTMKDGQLNAQGEQVARVFVDGKPFFGDDASIALKNLPADVVEKVEVYDRQSERAQFTGFRDGETQKTINIVTKKDKRKGVFGKVYGGYGTDNRYKGGGNANFFNGNQRITIIGLSNNINQVNFSSDDLSAINENRGGRRRRSWRRDDEDFQVGSLSGITTTNSFGINYSDSIGKKASVTGSYFFNRINNENRQFLNRNYYLPGDSTQLYTEESSEENINTNHRVNLRIDYTIDTSNSILITPRVTLQTANSNSLLDGATYVSPFVQLSATSNSYDYMANNIDFSNEALFRHRFKKKGRTFSMEVETDYTQTANESNLLALNQYFTEEGVETDSIRQSSDLNIRVYNIEAEVAYTEPVGENSQIEIEYNSEVSNSNYDKETFQLEEVGPGLNLDSSLSGDYESVYYTNRLELDYDFRSEKMYFSVGANVQNVQLNNEQQLPMESNMHKSFNSILPKAAFRYEFSKSKTLRLYYRARTNVPSISKLQNIIDNRNPLLVSKGNPDLRQEYSNRLISRIGLSGENSYNSLNAFIYVQNTFDYVGNAVFIPDEDSVLTDDYVLREGAQLTTPVNLDGYWRGRGSLTYSFPLDLIKSNIGLTSGYNYTRTPGLINGRKNIVNSHRISQGLTIGSNISENLDFTLEYEANYNLINSALQPALNNNYFSHNLEFRFEYIFWKGFLIQSNIGHFTYRGLSSGFDQDFILWNAAIGKKLFKDQQGEIRLSVFDILDQNNSISRNVTENYVEDVSNRILNRYFMLTFTYNFRKF